MSKSSESVSPVAEESPKVTYPVYEVSRKILLAAIGAVALTQDALEEFVEKLIDRGEIAENDGRRLIKEISEKRKASLMGGEGERHKHFRDVMKKLNIPTRKDIEELNEKIAELTKKIDELKKG